MKPLLILLALTLSLVTARADDAAVLAIFDKHCAQCHKEDETPELHGGINLTSHLSTEGEADDILDRVQRADLAKGRMPKTGKGKPGDPGYVAPLTAEEVATLKAWAKGEAPRSGAVAFGSPSDPAAAPTDAKPNIPPSATPTPKPEDKQVSLRQGDKTAAGSEGLPKATTPLLARRSFIPMRDEVKAIAADVLKLAPAVQPFTRYLTLTNLVNLRDAKGQPTESDLQLDTYRAALGKLLNSISRSGRIAVPTSVDVANTIYRVDLRDYALTPSDWEDYVVKGYPYALRGIDGRAEDDIAKATRSMAAWVRADWFAFAASQPPLYHDLLKLPKTEHELEAQLGVDTHANLRAGHAIRAGFRISGVSQGNRLIERHEAGTGMYWKSYDFTPLVRDGGHDLFRSPLGPVGAGLTKNEDREFRHDGGEFIFSLPNGMHAYLLATSDGKRINRGPTEIVQDKKRRDGAILNGISCMACHDQGMKYARDEGIEKFIDEVGPVALKAGLDRDETHIVQDLYVSPDRLHAAVQSDEAKFKTVLAQAMPGYTQTIDPVSRLYNRFKEEIKLDTLAAEFGEQDASFVQRLKDTRSADMESIAAQFESGLGFPRASWLDQFQSIAKALGYQLQNFRAIDYAEFTSGAAKAGGNEGKVTLSDGGRLTIATDKAHYIKGDLLSVKMKCTEGVFVRLYHFSADKKLKQIFPNRKRTDNFVKGGETVTFPAAGDKFAFQMGEPFGTEVILAVASPVQFTDTENLTFDAGELFKSFNESDLRLAQSRGTKGLEVIDLDPAGKPRGTRAAPVFQARAVYDVSEK